MADVDANGAVAGPAALSAAGLLLQLQRFQTSWGFTAPFIDQNLADVPQVSRRLLPRCFTHFAHLRRAPLIKMSPMFAYSARTTSLQLRFGRCRAGDRARFRLRLQQPRQASDQFLIVALAFFAGGIDAAQHLADRIHHGQQRSRDLGIQSE